MTGEHLLLKGQEDIIGIGRARDWVALITESCADSYAVVAELCTLKIRQKKSVCLILLSILCVLNLRNQIQLQYSLLVLYNRGISIYRFSLFR